MSTSNKPSYDRDRPERALLDPIRPGPVPIQPGPVQPDPIQPDYVTSGYVEAEYDRPDDGHKLRGAAMLALGAAAVAGGVFYASRNTKLERRSPNDAPARTRKSSPGDLYLTGRTVTIDKPARELYDYWRDFQNLPRFMDNVVKVTPKGGDGAAVWTIKAPHGTVDVETRLVDDIPGERIAWRSVEGSDIETEGHVAFKEAGKRGTFVEAVVAYRPPAGAAGRLIAKLFRREPQIQARHDLKRFKMLMETGEIAISDHYNIKE